jgi:hypothetical protein
LSHREPLRDSLDKENKQRKGSIWYSKAYHRYFEGYSEVRVPNPNGKGTRIERIYTGMYYRQDLTTRQRILLRALYVALFLGAAYLFVSSAVQPLASNSTWYVVLPQAVCLPLLFWIVIAFYYYLPAARDMTIGEYRNASPALQKAAFYAAISLGAAAVATLVYVLLHLLLHPAGQPLVELLCAVKYLASGVSVLMINRVEKKVRYLEIPSQNKVLVEEI